MSDFSVIIPARYGSTRLPAKALADIGGKPLIWHVAQRALDSNASQVIIATDDQRIMEAVKDIECEAVMTSAVHQSGSDRLAEVVTMKAMAKDHIVVNVQGDEPTIPPKLINEVAQKLADNPAAVMATAAKQIDQVDDIENPNVVKVVTDLQDRALYFSRAPIPHDRDQCGPASAWHHIGIYAYRAGFLQQFTELAPSPLELKESLEQLRVLEQGETIMVHKIDYDAGVGVDTEADLERARDIMQSRAW